MSGHPAGPVFCWGPPCPGAGSVRRGGGRLKTFYFQLSAVKRLPHITYLQYTTLPSEPRNLHASVVRFWFSNLKRLNDFDGKKGLNVSRVFELFVKFHAQHDLFIKFINSDGNYYFFIRAQFLASLYFNYLNVIHSSHLPYAANQTNKNAHQLYQRNIRLDFCFQLHSDGTYMIDF